MNSIDYTLGDTTALFEDAADRLGLEPAARQLLAAPEREILCHISIRMDDGSHRIFGAHRVRHNSAYGPTLGGIRWHPAASLTASRDGAAWNTWQAALLDIPHGGSAGAVDCNPKELSTVEKERLARRFVSVFRDVIGPGHDVLLADTYVTPQILGWMTAAYELFAKVATSGSTVGKPAALGGTLPESESIARGGVAAVVAALEEADLDPATATYGVVGFGPVGRAAARYHMERVGGRFVTASDSRGGVRATGTGGFEPDSLVRHKVQTGRVVDLDGAENVSNADVLAAEVDVLYIACPAQPITAEVAASVGGKILCELSDAPTTKEADPILLDKGVVAIPDLLAGGGRLLIAHLETVQNAQNDRWPLEDVHHRLDAGIHAAFSAIHEMAHAEGCSLRTAAWMCGIERVAEACRARGWC